MISRILVLLSLFTTITMARPELRDGTIHVLFSGDHADPTIVRDGEDFYLTYSSYTKYPGLKIWHSTDLLNWTPVGYALHQDVGSVWAPDFIKYNGLFTIYFPTSKGENYVVTATDPAGPWSDPVKLEVSGIDPGHIATPEGERFIYLNAGKFAHLSPDGLSVTVDAVKRYDGWPIPTEWEIECFCLESPKLMHRGDWFYLTSAQGGTAGPATSHMVVSARARSPEGPWEESPFNPIVHTWSSKEDFWSKGHGTVFDDAAGDWYVIYHGYLRGHLAWGRHMLLEAIEWTDDGWFRTVRDAMTEGPIVFHANERIKDDAFTGKNPGLQWQFGGIVEPDVQVRMDTDAMILTPAEGQTVTAQVNPDEKSFEVSIELSVEGSDMTAGLVIYYSDDRHVGLGLHAGELVRLINGRTGFEPGTASLTRHLKMRVRDHVATFFSSTDGRTWVKADRSYEISAFQHNSLGGFSYIRPAILARGDGEIRVSNFQFRPLP